MVEGSVGKRLWLSSVLCLCLSQPAESTPPPEKPSPVNMECVKAYPFIAGHAPSVSIVDPNTGIALCNGLILPTSLVGYYVELDSWKDLAVVEIEQLEAQQPTMLEKWGDRAQWTAIGLAGGIALSALVFQAGP